MGTTLYICISCRGHPPASARVAPGKRLAQAVLMLADADLPLVPVACMNRCAHGCNAALKGADGRTRIIGGLGPEDAAAVIAWAEGGPNPGHLLAIIPPEPISKEK